MNSTTFLTSACRYCRHYNPEGRRGGTCQMLGAPVQANWKSCSLAAPTFAPSFASLEGAWNLPDATPALVGKSLSSGLDSNKAAIVQETAA